METEKCPASSQLAARPAAAARRRLLLRPRRPRTMASQDHRGGPIPHGFFQPASAPRRRHRPRGHGRGREARRLGSTRRASRRSRPRRTSSAARPMTRTARRSARPTWRGRRRRTPCCSARSAGRNGMRVPYDVAPGGGPAAAAQGSRAVRQSAPGDLLSGARRRLVAEARDRRGARHRHRPRTDRRRLFRRAEGDRRPRQRPEARHRHAGLRHLRDRAHRAASPSSSRASAATR